MADRVSVRTEKTRFIEGSQVIVSVNVRAGSAASVPTTLEWKLYSESRDLVLQDWTTLTAAAEASFSISAALNSCRDAHERERMELLVAADRGLATAVIGKAKYQVENIAGYDFTDSDLILNLLTQDYEIIRTETGEGIAV